MGRAGSINLSTMRFGMRVISLILLVLSIAMIVERSQVQAQLGYPLTIGTVTGDNLRVRGKPAFVGEALTTVDAGTKLDVYEVVTRSNVPEGEPAKWLKVRLPEEVDVWVSGLYIDKATYTVTASELRMRGGPGEEYSVLGMIPNGEKVKVVEIRESWMKIKNPGNATGYVAASYVDYQLNSAFDGPDTSNYPAPSVTSTISSGGGISTTSTTTSTSFSPSSLPEIYSGSGTSSGSTVNAYTSGGSSIPSRTSLFDSTSGYSQSSPTIDSTISVRSENSGSEVIYDYQPSIIDSGSSGSTTTYTSTTTTSGSSDWTSSTYSSGGSGRVTSAIMPDDEIGVFYDNPSYASSVQNATVSESTPISEYSSSEWTTTTTTSQPVETYYSSSASGYESGATTVYDSSTTYESSPVTTGTSSYSYESASPASEYSYTTTESTSSVSSGYPIPVSSIPSGDSLTTYEYAETSSYSSEPVYYQDSGTTVVESTVIEPTATVTGSTVTTSTRSTGTRPAQLRPALNSEDLESARQVIREGLVRGTLSLRSPSDWALINLENNRTMNFLWSPEYQLELGKLAGERVVIQGQEYVDRRWPKTPILKVTRIMVP